MPSYFRDLLELILLNNEICKCVMKNGGLKFKNRFCFEFHIYLLWNFQHLKDDVFKEKYQMLVYKNGLFERELLALNNVKECLLSLKDNLFRYNDNDRTNSYLYFMEYEERQTLVIVNKQLSSFDKKHSEMLKLPNFRLEMNRVWIENNIAFIQETIIDPFCIHMNKVRFHDHNNVWSEMFRALKQYSLELFDSSIQSYLKKWNSIAECSVCYEYQTNHYFSNRCGKCKRNEETFVCDYCIKCANNVCPLCRHNPNLRLTREDDDYDRMLDRLLYAYSSVINMRDNRQVQPVEVRDTFEEANIHIID
jgi:hypothetical protein